MTENFDFFIFTETNLRPWAEQVAMGASCFTLALPVGTPIGEALAAARAAGMPQGTSRSGCFEVQTDSGIHQRVDGRGWGRITESNSEFLTWDQLDAREAA